MAEMWQRRLGVRRRSPSLLSILGAIVILLALAILLVWLALAAPGVAWSLCLPVVSGVMTALAWAAMVWGYMRFRDCRLDSQVRETLSHFGTWNSVAGRGLTITNRTQVPLTIRDVEALLVAAADQDDVRKGQAMGSHTLNYFSDDRRSGEMDRNGRWFERESSPQSDVRGFVHLPPYTQGAWGLREETLVEAGKRHKYQKFYGCRITVEFLTLLRNLRVTEVCLDGNNDNGLSACFNKVAGLAEKAESKD